MNREKLQIRLGFTMAEMVMVLLMFSVIVVTVGFIEGDNLRAWGSLHDQAFSKTIEEGRLAGDTFETICRKSSRQSCSITQGGTSCTLYYYDNMDAESPDRYATFYLKDGTLYIEHGSSDEIFFDIPLADNIENILFWKNGDAVKMEMTLNDGEDTMLFIYSAIRYAQ